jgi:hypothetical protein
LFFFPLSKPLLPSCNSFHFHSKQNKTKTNWKKWHGAADLSLDQYSPPREQYQLVHLFNILLRLPFVLIFFTLAVLLSLFLGNKFFSIISFLSSVRFIAILQFQFSFMNFIFEGHWEFSVARSRWCRCIMPMPPLVSLLTFLLNCALVANCLRVISTYLLLLLVKRVWINNLIKCL